MFRESNADADAGKWLPDPSVNAAIIAAAPADADADAWCGHTFVVLVCLFVCGQIFLKKLTPDGSVLTLKTLHRKCSKVLFILKTLLLKDIFCKKLISGGFVHRRCLKTLFSLNDI